MNKEQELLRETLSCPAVHRTKGYVELQVPIGLLEEIRKVLHEAEPLSVSDYLPSRKNPE